MASRTVWHFAYGSYMNRAQMLSRAGTILEERNASLPNYEVRFNKKVRGGTAGANIQMASGKTVHGVLYKVEENALRSLGSLGATTYVNAPRDPGITTAPSVDGAAPFRCSHPWSNRSTEL